MIDRMINNPTNNPSVESFTESFPDSLEFYELGRMLSDAHATESVTLQDLSSELLTLRSRAFRIFSMDDTDRDEFIGLLFFPTYEDESTYEEFGNVVFSQCLNASPGLWVSPPVEMHQSDAVKMAQTLQDLYVRKYLHLHDGRVRPLWVLLGLKPSRTIANA